MFFLSLSLSVSLYIYISLESSLLFYEQQLDRMADKGEGEGGEGGIERELQKHSPDQAVAVSMQKTKHVGWLVVGGDLAVHIYALRISYILIILEKLSFHLLQKQLKQLFCIVVN
jgi:hypothetical protein